MPTDSAELEEFAKSHIDKHRYEEYTDDSSINIDMKKGWCVYANNMEFLSKSNTWHEMVKCNNR